MEQDETQNQKNLLETMISEIEARDMKLADDWLNWGLLKVKLQLIDLQYWKDRCRITEMLAFSAYAEEDTIWLKKHKEFLEQNGGPEVGEY